MIFLLQVYIMSAAVFATLALAEKWKFSDAILLALIWPIALLFVFAHFWRWLLGLFLGKDWFLK